MPNRYGIISHWTKSQTVIITTNSQTMYALCIDYCVNLKKRVKLFLHFIIKRIIKIRNSQEFNCLPFYRKCFVVRMILVKFNVQIQMSNDHLKSTQFQVKTFLFDMATDRETHCAPMAEST